MCAHCYFVDVWNICCARSPCSHNLLLEQDSVTAQSNIRTRNVREKQAFPPDTVPRQPCCCHTVSVEYQRPAKIAALCSVGLKYYYCEYYWHQWCVITTVCLFAVYCMSIFFVVFLTIRCLIGTPYCLMLSRCCCLFRYVYLVCSSLLVPSCLLPIFLFFFFVLVFVFLHCYYDSVFGVFYLNSLNFFVCFPVF